MTIANPCIPLFEPSDEITMIADATLAGCTFVSVKANTALDSTSGLQRCVQTAADAKPFGVIHGDHIQHQVCKVIMGNKIVPVRTVAAIQSGQGLEVGTAGKVVPFNDGIRVGTALTNAADGELCFVRLEL